MASKSKLTNSLKNPYGMKDGRFVHVGEVESGLASGCTCPVTGIPLKAHKGNGGIRHHFALSTSSENVSFESFFHRLAKQLIEDRGTMALPASCIWGTQHSTMEVAASRSYSVTKVITEKAIPRTSFIADNIVEIDSKEIVIEWRYSHRCENQKIDTIPQIELVTEIEKALREIKPDIVYIHNPTDINKDHEI